MEFEKRIFLPGPKRVPGTQFVPDYIPVLIGKVTINLQ
jgi:hypothetical protein